MRLVLIGFGTVGQGFTEILRDKATTYATQHDFKPRIVGVATRSRGVLYDAEGLAPDDLLTQFETHPARRDWDVSQLIARADADTLIEASSTDLQTAQPATDYVLQALARGMDVILANKGPIALHHARLQAAAREQGCKLRYEATVMAGTPAIALASEALAGCTITQARGILNGTTNYILTQMTNGMTYSDALAQAQALGYAETDPSGDVEGWDAAGKVLIIAAALLGAPLTLSDLVVQGITQITPQDIAAARDAGERYKLIATATPQGGTVAPVRVPLSDPLASVDGATNAITFTTDLLGDVTLVGAGAGRKETGLALVGDALALYSHRKK